MPQLLRSLEPYRRQIRQARERFQRAPEEGRQALRKQVALGNLFAYALFGLGILIFGLILFAGCLPAMLWGAGFLLLIAFPLWLRLPKPPGVRVYRPQAKPLFSDLDQLRDRLNAPEPNELVLSSECATSYDRILLQGFFSPPFYSFRLGVPLLHILTPGELRSALCHTLAQERFEGPQAFLRLWRTLNQSPVRWNHLIVAAFAEKYRPGLEIQALPVLHASVFEADRVALEQFPDAWPRAMMKIALWEALLRDGFWPKFESGRPQERMLARMEAFLKREVPPMHAVAVLRALLETRPDDLHATPTLGERLDALGHKPAYPDEASWTRLATELLECPEPSIDGALGVNRERIERQIDEDWKIELELGMQPGRES